jgi:hypothetical protein
MFSWVRDQPDCDLETRLADLEDAAESISSSTDSSAGLKATSRGSASRYTISTPKPAHTMK